MQTTVTTIPTELLRSDYSETQEKTELPLTVYSCRFSTGHGRGAGMSDQMSFVNICLIAKDGRSVMHRISPVNDPQMARHGIEMMCQIIDDAVGADCQAVLSHPENASSTTNTTTTPSGYTLPPKPPPAPRARFQEGTVDEVVFLAPELGPLAGVLVGTESGTWVLEELQVASSRTHHIDRFICRRLLGNQPGQGAAFLPPVAPGAQVYGSGDLQRVLTKEQATTLHALNMDAYQDLKKRLLTTTALLTAGGAGVAGLAAGLDGAVPFALGGLAGVAYQWLLQQSVDGIVATTATPGSSPFGRGSPSPPRIEIRGEERPLSATATLDDPAVFIDFVEVDPDGTIVVQQKPPRTAAPVQRNILGSPAVRIAFIAALTGLTVSLLSGNMPEGATGLPTLQREQMWQLVLAVMGFMSYKVALISVSLSSPAAPAEVAKPVMRRTTTNNSNGQQN